MSERHDAEGWYAAEEEFLREERSRAAGTSRFAGALRAGNAGRQEKVSPGEAACNVAVTTAS